MSDASLSSAPAAPEMPNQMPPMEEPMPEMPQENDPSKEKKDIQKEIGSACQKFRDYQGEDKEELSKWIEGMLDSLNDSEGDGEQPEEMPEEMPAEAPAEEQPLNEGEYESDTEIAFDLNGNTMVFDLEWNEKRNTWFLNLTNTHFEDVPNSFRCDNPDKKVATKLAKKYIQTHDFAD